MQKWYLFFTIIVGANGFCMQQSSIPPYQNPDFLYEQTKIVFGNIANLLTISTFSFLPLPERLQEKCYIKTLKMVIPDLINLVSRFYFRTESEPYSTVLALLYVMEDEIRIGKKIIDNVRKKKEIFSEENELLAKRALVEFCGSTSVILTNVLWKYFCIYYDVKKPEGYPQ